MDTDEVEAALAHSFLKTRVRDVSLPALTEGTLPSPDTVAGAFIRELEARIAELEATARRVRGTGSRGRRAARRAASGPAAPGRTRGLAVRIRRLRVQNLRRYRELDIDLAPGLTIVRGPNEAGKSTIQRAIELAITRRVTSAAGDLESLRPWDAAEGAQTVVAIEFDQDEENGARSGTLEKTFAGSKGTVDLQYDGQSVTDPALADQILAELTGIPTEGFFRSTGSVRHMEVAGLARDESALRDRLQASISGADRGTSHARKKLDKALHDLTTRGDKNPGPAQDRRAGRRPGGRRGRAGRTGPGPAGTRSRQPVLGSRPTGVRRKRSLTERRALLEKARQAERLGHGTRCREGALRAVPPGRRGQRRVGHARHDPPVPEPTAGPAPGRGAPAGRRHAACVNSARCCPARWTSSSRSRRRRAWQPLSRPGPSRWSSSASSLGRLAFAGHDAERRGPRADPAHHRPGHRRRRARPGGHRVRHAARVKDGDPAP